jgi:predicted amidohydrolase YtcJ
VKKCFYIFELSLNYLKFEQMKTKFILLIPMIGIFFNTGCKMREHADTLVIHSKIYTVDADNKVFSAMAIRDGKVIELGFDSVLQLKYEARETIDAGGGTILPGFIDAHCHFWGMAMGLQYIDLNGSASFDEVIARIGQGVSSDASGWIVGRGWDNNLWKEKTFPDNARLNALYPDRPVMLIRIDGHVVLANKEALRRAGIGISNGFMKGEVVVRNGILTGILSENAADKMRSAVPLPDEDGTIALISKAEQLCLGYGLTGVGDAGLLTSEVLLIDTLQKLGKLSLNCYAMLTPTPENIHHFVLNGPYETERLSVRSIKMYADGSLGSRTALLKRPYSDDPGNTGMRTTSQDSMRTLCEIANQHGYQVNTHAIGDSACRIMLELYAGFLKGENDKRWRIEHAQVVDPDDLHLFKENSIIPSVQSTHATSDMYWAENRLGPERIKWAYAYKNLLEQNGWIANGTDFPIEQISPLLTFYAAVARKDLKGFPPEGFQMQNALTREEALRSVTIWAAKANFQEQKAGSLEPGKNADFIILDKDIMVVPDAEIPAIKVLETHIHGKRVFRRSE